ncbi:MAG: hypothetical protein HDR03_14110 [Lachnospiraceae bacterium]|nr:hypothetical protein [Lachnospiraceae bacterium]
MSKLASKLNKRIMAAVLSVAMVMSNMTVYASEPTGTQANNTVVEEASGAEDTSVTLDNVTTSDDNTDTDAVAGDTTNDLDNGTTDNVTGDDAQTPDTGEGKPSDADKVDEVVADEEPLENAEMVNEGEAVDISGTVEGLDDTTGLKLIFTNDDEESEEVVNVTTFEAGTGDNDGKFTYTASLTQGETYTVTAEGATDYTLSVVGSDDCKVTVDDENTVASIIFTAKTPGTATKKTYTFNATTLKAAGYSVGDTFPSETLLGTDLYFKVMAKTIDNPITTETDPTITGTVPFVNKSSTDLVEISRLGTSGIEFNVKGTADVTITVASTGTNNYSQYALMNSSDEYVSDGITSSDLNSIATGEEFNDEGIQDGIIKVKGTGTKVITYTGLTAGKYTLLSPYIVPAADGTDLTNEAYKRGGRVISIVVEDTAVHSERGAFSSVAAPEIVSAEQKEGTSDVEVEVNAAIGYDGGDKVTVTITDANNEVADTAISTVNGTSKLSLSLKDKASGVYTVKAVLSRGTDSKDGSETKSVTFKLPLASPTLKFTNNSTKAGGVDVTLSWAAVQEATGYSVTVTEKPEDDEATSTSIPVYTATLDSDDANTDGSFSVSFGGTNGVTGLELNKTYIFSVTSLRADPSAGEGATPESSKPETTTRQVSAMDDDEGGEPETYTFDATQLSAKDVTDGSSISSSTLEGYFDGYFSLTGNVTQRVNSSGATTSVEVTHEVKDPLSAITFTTKRLSNVVVEISSTGGSNDSTISLKNESDEVMQDATGEEAPSVTGTGKKTVTYQRLPKGTYYLYTGHVRHTRVYTITVTEGVTSSRAPWGNVADPEITGITLKDDKKTLSIAATADISDDGGDKLTVTMYDADGNAVVSSEADETAGTTHTLEIKPSATGYYTFKAELERNGVEDKHTSAVYPAEAQGKYYFLLPLEVPLITSATNKGAVGSDKTYGSAELSWNSVPEATGYLVKAVDKAAAADAEPAYDEELTTTSVLINTGLEIGHTYIFSVAAKRAGTGENETDEITATDTKELEIKDENKRTWAFSAYGDSTSTKTNGYTDADHVGDKSKTILDDSGDVRVWSEGGAGKIVPASVDGLAFYYTTVDPTVKNFTLSAIAHVNSWDISNGQDGFGLMAADRVGTHGDSGKWWNNSYQALASKIEYRWNPNLNAADYSSNVEYTKYSMKLGIGTTEKKGVTKENLPLLNDTDTVVDATKRYFKSTTKTLETYCGRAGLESGTWNVIGNYTEGNTPEGTVTANALVTDILFTIELNNTGYYLSYTPITVEKESDDSIKRDENGKVVYKITGETATNKHYDRNALSKLEEDTVYVGFFASRNADVTFMNIELNDSEAYDPDAEVEQQPIEKIDPSYGFTSGTTANDANYDLLFAANWQGYVTVKDSAGNVIVGYDTTPKGEEESYEDYIIRSGRILDETDSQTGEYLRTYEPIKVPVELGFGTTTFTYTFVPDGIDDYNPEPNSDYDAETNGSVPKGFTMLSDYSAQSGTIAVTYKTYGESGNALYVSPTGTALGNGTQRNPLDIYTAVKYVQAGQTIYLMDGTYNLTKTVTIDRGINGTADNRIYMLPADPSTRPVFNFNRQCEGIVAAGDYWYLKGFDVTGSANAKDGMRISGSHNVIEQVNAYMNGNTGIQISRYSGSDTWDYWPSYNLVLNCTSYLNADQGFEDADGFTAKLTIADGNVFDGCIAAYNADDGWDLFAKVESGNIGTVTIKNCIAYKNGYVLVKDTDGDGKISDSEARATDRVFSLTEGIETPAGNGNGFKLGGSNLPDKAGANGITGWDAGHRVENCLAFYNKAKGIDSNSCPNIKAKNSISYNNEGANVAFYGTASNTDFASDGLISYRTESAIEDMLNIHDNIQPLGTQLKNNGDTGMSAFYNNKSYYWNPTSKISIQIDAAATAAKIGDGKNGTWTDARPDKAHVVWLDGASDTKVEDNWFVKVGEDNFKLFDEGFRNDPSSIRNADATLTTDGFLMLTDNALVGESLGEADHEEQGKLPEIPDNVTETDGSISKGDAADETSGGVAPEDMDKFIELNGTIKDSEDIIGLWFNIVEEVSYTGKAIKPLVHVYNGTTQLTNKDYSITYKNNVNAYVADTTAKDYDASYAELKSKKKVPTIIVKGKGNYVGTVEATFDIHPVNLGNDSILNRVSANDLTLASTGKALNVKPVVTFGTRKLSNAKNKDYEIKGIYQITDTPVGGDAEPASDGDTSSGDNTDTNRTKVTSVTAKGTYEIDITGHGNFTGERTIGLRVYDKGSIDNDHLVSKFKVDKIDVQYREVVSTSNYTGAITAAVPKTPALTVKNSKGEVHAVDTVDGNEKVNYVVTYKNNVEIGTATAIITGVGDYYGTKEVKFRIMAPAINLMERQKELTVVDTSKAVNETTHMYPEFVNKTTEYPFVGKAIEPPIAVQLKDGTLLTKDVDYVLSFRNNNRAGTASVVIKGKGNYSGSISKTFKVTVFDLADAKNRQYIGGTFKFASETKTEGDGENATTSVVYTDKYATTLSVAAEKGVNKPNVTLTINGVTMKSGRDYTVTYKNNTYAAQLKNKQPQVIITGRGALKGKLTKDFTITKKNLNQVTVTAQDVKISSKKGDAVSGNISARIVLQDLNGKRLSPGADYDKNITYILLDDYGNESGTSTTKGSIENNKRITINKSTNVLTVRAIIKASTAANTSYTGQTTVDFQVGYAKQALSSARFEINYNNGKFKYFNYTGDNIVITDNLKVYFDKNNPLVVNEDYEILPATYKNNNKKGTASVVIRGKGNYSGTKVITFRIGAQNISEIGWWTAK